MALMELFCIISIESLAANTKQAYRCLEGFAHFLCYRNELHVFNLLFAINKLYVTKLVYSGGEWGENADRIVNIVVGAYRPSNLSYI